MNSFAATGRVRPRVVLFLGIVLAASAVYLVALLFAYAFGVGSIRRHHVESASYIFAAAAVTVTLTRWRRTSPAPISPPRTAWLVLGFIASALALYGNTISLGLFSDDFALVGRALAGDWLPQPEFIRPLPLAIWRVILGATGSPAALHVFSVSLHGVNGALVSVLAHRLGLPAVPAIAAGALFVAFPSSVETVVWPAAVHDLLVAGCALGFVVLSGGPANGYRILLSAMLVAVGLLSKESAIVIPVLGLVLWAGVRGREQQTVSWPVLITGAAVCLVYGALRMTVATMPGSYTQEPSRYLVKELIARPVGTLALPWTSSVFAAWPAIPFLWGTMCIAAGALYAWRIPKGVAPSAVLRCLVAMFVAVLPVYSMLFITPDLENARYLYLSTAFWVVALLAAFSAGTGLTRTRLAVAGGAFLVAASGVQVHLSSWREAARLRDDVLASAQDVVQNAPCAPVSLAGAPDSVRGAYVFRNGLSEAVAWRTGAMPTSAADSACVFVWNGASFGRASTVSVPVQASFSR